MSATADLEAHMAISLSEYLKDSRREFAQVTWPSREMALRLSLFVIILTLVISAFLGALDYLFTYILKTAVIPH